MYSPKHPNFKKAYWEVFILNVVLELMSSGNFRRIDWVVLGEAFI
ncbi:MAG: hypothetical protein P8J71_02225 [Flavobacteriaceae bacterium]|nr:hypothetical protein [Flavobacteriaceae bacterium]